MAVKNPIGIDANGDLYEMDATDLATKNPICLYSGELKELQSGDTLPGGGGGGGTDPIIREYTANATWTKPAGLYAITVICVGAGGGGGSGRRGTGTERKGGGNGGGGGGYAKRYIKAADLGATETIVVGAGGTGAAAQTADSTNGNQGTQGGTTEFGSGLCKGEGGEGGIGGNTQTSSLGTATLGGDVYPVFLPRGFVGSQGGRGGGSVISTSNRNGKDGGSVTGGSGGGAGGGYQSTTKRAPGKGGGQYAWPTVGVTAGGAVPAAADGTNGNNGTDDINTYITDDIDTPLTIGMGTGASGGRVGDTAGTIAGGNGGDSGKAAGGGGGGASYNGANSGAGGNGGNGFCVVIEFYGA